MGVKGLWTILEPAGEPVNEASLSGHRLAIDASIWMYQLTRALPSSNTAGYNPQILAGLFRRILKLLHFGIRPVFVFDGGVPELKAATVRERRGRRGEAESRYKSLAKKMLKIRLKMAALGNKGKAKEIALQKDEEAVLVEEEILSESSEEELFDIDYDQLDRLDITTPDFQSLPLDLKQELLTAMKERALEEKTKAFSSFSNDALTFSQGQIEALVKRRRIASELERVSRSSFGAFGKPSGLGGQNHRIASSSTREFVLVKNESGAGWAFDHKVDESVVVPEQSSPSKKSVASVEDDEEFERMFFDDQLEVAPVLPKPVARNRVEESKVEVKHVKETATAVQTVSAPANVDFISEGESEDELLEASEIAMKAKPLDNVIEPVYVIEKQNVNEYFPIAENQIEDQVLTEDETDLTAPEPLPVSIVEPRTEAIISDEDDDLEDFLESFKTTTKEELEARLRQSLIEAQTDLKSAQNESRGLENELLADFKQLLGLFGIPWMMAEMEAEAQCAWLYGEGMVDGVVTDDSDVWVFGEGEGLIVYRNFFKVGRPVLGFGGHRIALQLELRREDLVCLAMWLGGDYGVGVQGLGTTRALSLLRLLKRSQTYSRLETDPVDSFDYCLALLNLFKTAHEDFDSCRAEWELADQQALEKILKQVHHLDADFPSTRIIDAYLKPSVNKDSRHFKWHLPNIIGLEAFLMARLEWSVERTKSQLLPVLRSKKL